MSSPFKDIKLVEKKETKKVEKKVVKPSSIVQGYDPKASFKDILASYEKTGNPYALPKSSANNSSTNDESFASILDKWENKTKPKAKEEYKRVSAKYEAKRSFADILAAHENPNGIKSTPKVETKEKPVKQTKGEYTRVSKTYEGKQSFSDILSSFENPVIAKKEEVIVKKNKKSKVAVVPEVKKASFFKEKEEDDEREKDVTWSIFGDNKKVEREVVKEVVVEEEKVVEEVRNNKSSYEASKSFSDILNAFDNKEIAKVVETTVVAPAKVEVIEEPSKKESFFKEKDEDDVREKDVTWSIFGDNKKVEREVVKEVVVEEEKVVEEVRHNKSSYEASKSFSDILNAFENNEGVSKVVKTPSNTVASEVNKTAFKKDNKFVYDKPKTTNKTKSTKDFNSIIDKFPVLDFEAMLEEKNEKVVEKRKTIQEKRNMKPEVFFDIHGFTAEEANVEVDLFLDSCLENKICKASIIYGKGLHSESGIPVLKPLINAKLSTKDFISEYSSPSENFGGDGAIWIIFK